MTTISGYLVTITAFVPADPKELPSMAAATETIFSNTAAIMRGGMKEVAFDYRFVARHKSPSPPSAPDPAEPPQPLDNAPAGTVAGSASDISFGDLARAINGGPCRHPRQKRYAGGQLACLDCQAIVAEAGAA